MSQTRTMLLAMAAAVVLIGGLLVTVVVVADRARPVPAQPVVKTDPAAAELRGQVADLRRELAAARQVKPASAPVARPARDEKRIQQGIADKKPVPGMTEADLKQFRGWVADVVSESQDRRRVLIAVNDDRYVETVWFSASVRVSDGVIESVYPW